MNSILVCLDGSPLAESILPTVRDLGRRSGAEIVLLHVVQLPASVSTEGRIAIDEIVAHQEREASHYLRRLAEALTADGITARTVRAIGASASEIVRVAEHEQADLIALTTHGRSGLKHWLYGSVTDAVLHETTRPLLVLRPHEQDRPATPVRRVVAALDGSAVAEHALARACEIARSIDASLVLLRVVDPLPPGFAMTAIEDVAYGTLLAGLEAEADEYLADVAARERKRGLSVEAVRKTGVPAEMIASYGETHPQDLVVLATHGRTGWRAALMGSVARRVVLLSHGPILVVPAPRAVVA